MNALTIRGGSPVTMTSLELVEFINSQRGEGEAKLEHYDFLKKVPQVLGAEVAGNFSCYYKASNGKQNPMYTFPKREACLMAMSYSYDLQAKVFDRMTELEAKVAQPAIPQTLPEALRLAAEAIERNERLALENKAQAETLAEQAPKIQALERISAGKDSLTLTQTAKVLGVKIAELTATMHAKNWIYRQNGSWVGYDPHIKNGDLAYKEANYTDEKTELACIKPYCHVTPRGLVKLAVMFGIQLPNADQHGRRAA